MSSSDRNGEDAEQRMLGATPGVPALGRGPVPSDHYSRHEYHHLAAGWGVSVGFGRTHDRRYTVLLRDLVLSGRARPSAVVTHHGRLDDAPGLFRAFDQRRDGVIKAVLRP